MTRMRSGLLSTSRYLLALTPSRTSWHFQRGNHRTFSSTPRWNIRTSELQPNLLSSLRANPSRLWNDIHSTAQFGIGNRYGDSPEETGLNRLALSPADKQARDWFTKTTEDLGCKVFVDEIGNQFAIRPGLKSYAENHESGKPGLDVLNSPATFTGSHLDSQPQGGRFDGMLGVCAGIEMLRVLDENWIETEGPVGVVNWTNEEGKRWKRSMMGSTVWAEGTKKALEDTWALEDIGESGKVVTVKDELQNIGYLGKVAANHKSGIKMAGHFELHIEQAKRLEQQRKKVAVVSGVKGYKWFTVAITGSEGHASSVWEDRKDAMLCSANIIRDVTDIVRQEGGLVTFGCLDVSPGSVNVVPGKVKMTMDVRFEKAEDLKRVENIIMEELEKNTVGFQVDLKEDFSNQPMHFDPLAMECVSESAKSVTGSEASLLISGAGHDSVNTARHCPTAMIFVPCRDGVTHNIREWCSEEDSAIGASVLLQSVLRFDSWRHRQGHFV
jgi:hydantoinase/carbamoylase family amidase